MPEVPIPVKSVSGYITAGSSVGLLLMFSVALLVAIVKIAPRWRELGIGARRDDLDDMRSRIADLEAKVEKASETAHNAEMRLVYAVSAVQLLMGEIRTRDKDSPVLRQAAELLAAATGSGMPDFSSKLMQGLHEIRATQ